VPALGPTVPTRRAQHCHVLQRWCHAPNVARGQEAAVVLPSPPPLLPNRLHPTEQPADLTYLLPTWFALGHRYAGAADIPIVRLNPLGILDVKRQGEEALRNGGSSYVIVRPCGLNDKWPSGRPIMSQGDVAVGRINRDDVAQLLTSMVCPCSATDRYTNIVCSCTDADTNTLHAHAQRARTHAPIMCVSIFGYIHHHVSMDTHSHKHSHKHTKRPTTFAGGHGYRMHAACACTH
jgi:hypothetical protein